MRASRWARRLEEVFLCPFLECLWAQLTEVVTGDVDAADLPQVKLPDTKPRHTVYVAGKGKLVVTVRHKDKSFTDIIDPKKASQRRRLIQEAGQKVGAGDGLGELAEVLDKIAAGDISPEPSPATAATEIFHEVDSGFFVRPERLMICGPTEEVSAITVPVRLRANDSLGTAWQMYIRRGDCREAIPLPKSLEVDGTTHYLTHSPTVPTKPMGSGWSKEGRSLWLATGSDLMPAPQLLEELVDALSQFIELPSEEAAPVYRLLALYAVLTYNSPAFSAKLGCKTA